MRKVLTMVGLVLHIIYYIFAILSLGNYEYAGYGVGKAFAFWIYATIISLPCLSIYLIDAIKSILTNKKIFNILKLVIIVLAVPLWRTLGGSGNVVCLIIWNIYFAIVFFIQIMSLFVKCDKNQ